MASSTVPAQSTIIYDDLLALHKLLKQFMDTTYTEPEELFAEQLIVKTTQEDLQAAWESVVFPALVEFGIKHDTNSVEWKTILANPLWAELFTIICIFIKTSLKQEQTLGALLRVLRCLSRIEKKHYVVFRLLQTILSENYTNNIIHIEAINIIINLSREKTTKEYIIRDIGSIIVMRLCHNTNILIVPELLDALLAILEKADNFDCFLTPEINIIHMLYHVMDNFKANFAVIFKCLICLHKLASCHVMREYMLSSGCLIRIYNLLESPLCNNKMVERVFFVLVRLVSSIKNISHFTSVFSLGYLQAHVMRWRQSQTTLHLYASLIWNFTHNEELDYDNIESDSAPCDLVAPEFAVGRMENTYADMNEPLVLAPFELDLNTFVDTIQEYMYGIPPFPPQFQRPEPERQGDEITLSRNIVEMQDFVPMSVFDFMLSMLEHEKPAIVAVYLNAFSTIVRQPANIVKLVNRGFVERLLSLYRSENSIIKQAALQTLVAIAKYHQRYHTVIGKLQHVECVKVNEYEFGEPKIKYGIICMQNIDTYLQSDLFNTKECLYVEAHMVLMHFLICCGVEITSTFKVLCSFNLGELKVSGISETDDIFTTLHPTILEYVDGKHYQYIQKYAIPSDLPSGFLESPVMRELCNYINTMFSISYDVMKLIQQKIFRERMTKIMLFMTASKDRTKQLLSSDFIKYELAPFLG